MQKTEQVTILILIFFIAYASFGIFNYYNYGTPNATNDFTFHFYKARGECPKELQGLYGVNCSSDYPPLFHLIFNIFSGNELFFYAVMVVLITILVPLMLFNITGNELSVFLYFLGIALPHAIIYNATYPELLILIYLLAYIYIRRKTNINKWLCLIILISLSFLTHRYGAILFTAIILIELILKIKEKYWLGFTILNGATLQNPFFLVNAFLLQINPIISVMVLKAKKDKFLLLIALTGFLGAFFLDVRIFQLTEISFILLASQEDPKINKYLLFGLLLFTFIFNFLGFLQQTEKYLNLKGV